MNEAKKKPYPKLRIEEEGLYEWCPGNGGRYYIALVKTGRGSLVTWLKRDDVGGQTMLLLHHMTGELNTRYFMEKMGMDNKPDAEAILQFLVEMEEEIKGYW